MTPSTPGFHDGPSHSTTGRDGRPGADGELRRELAVAAEQLRERSRGRAVEIADRVLLSALAARRRSYPVRGQGAHAYVFVSDRVIIAALRSGIDQQVVNAAVAGIVLDITRDHELTGVAIELNARFGTVLVEVADQARAIAARWLHDLLGVDPDVTVQPTAVAMSAHVHVRDVTRGDPHLVDPNDE